MSAYTPGPWNIDSHALGIWAPNARIGGDTKIFDIRGWGYLTGKGHGALGLDQDTAKAIQIANGRIAAAAPDLLEALQTARHQVVAFMLDNHTPEQALRNVAYADAAIAKATGNAP